MTAATTLRQPNISRAPGALILIATLAFLSGVATTVAIEGASRGAVTGAAAVQAAPTFDAVTFRAEERAGSYPAPTFDAVTFRAEERAERHHISLPATIGTGPTSGNGLGAR